MTVRPRDRVALGGVALVALIAAFYLLLLAPARHHASRLASAISTQQAALSQAESDYTSGKAARSALVHRSTDWSALRRAVPRDSNIPALLRILQRDASAVGVKMDSITLSGDGTADSGAPAGSSTTAAAAAAGDSASGSSATSVPLTLTFAGGYTALDALVKRLDGLVVISGDHVHASGPLLTITSVSLSDSKGLTVQLTANIYQLAGARAAGTTTGGAS